MKQTNSLILAVLVIISLISVPAAVGDFGGWDDGWSNGWDDGWSSGWDDGWSNGFDDGWSNGWDDGSIDDGSGDIDPDDWGDDEPDDNDWPPYWNLLDAQSVLEDSPDSTVVYPNLRGECIISNSNANVAVVSHVPNYELAMQGNDLVISNLQSNYWDNGNIVSLTCNGVASFFRLTVTPVNDAPQIINLTEITIRTNETLRLNLVNHEYDPDNSHNELSWNITPAAGAASVFTTELNGKIFTIIPRSVGASQIKFHLEDPSGLFDEKTVLVKVIPAEGPAPQPPAEEESDRIAIFISSIRLNSDGYLNAGDSIEAFVSIRNSGDVDLDGVRITMVIQDLAARGVAGPFDLDKGETSTKRLLMDIDEDSIAASGTYDIRFTISNDISRRVVYREADVEFE